MLNLLTLFKSDVLSAKGVFPGDLPLKRHGHRYFAFSNGESVGSFQDDFAVSCRRAGPNTRMNATPLPPIKVATYNIHSCLGTDRRFVPGRVADVLNSLNADVLGLQEVGWSLRGHKGFDQFGFLQEETSYRIYKGLTKDHERAQFGNAILSKFPVRRLDLLDLTVPYRVNRGAIMAEIEIYGELVHVINAHLGLDPWERAAQVRRILKAAGDWGDRPMILMGDFNEWRINVSTLRALRRHFPSCFAPPSFHTRRPLLRYDRVYCSRHFDLLDGEVVMTPLSRRASDHLPVACELAPRLWGDASLKVAESRAGLAS